MNVNTNNNMQIRKPVQKTKIWKINFSRVKLILFIFFTVLILTMANVYNNRWGREVTNLDNQIQQLEHDIETSKIKNQELSNKTRLENKSSSINMHYNANSNVVVTKFN